jgi:hypothetical protein
MYISRGVLAGIRTEFLQDIGQHLVVDQPKPEGVVGLRQLPGMQGTEAPRLDELVAVFHFGKPLIFPAVHRQFQVFEHDKAYGTPLASVRGAQGVSIG